MHLKAAVVMDQRLKPLLRQFHSFCQRRNPHELRNSHCNISSWGSICWDCSNWLKPLRRQKSLYRLPRAAGPTDGPNVSLSQQRSDAVKYSAQAAEVLKAVSCYILVLRFTSFSQVSFGVRACLFNQHTKWRISTTIISPHYHLNITQYIYIYWLMNLGTCISKYSLQWRVPKQCAIPKSQIYPIILAGSTCSSQVV